MILCHLLRQTFSSVPSEVAFTQQSPKNCLVPIRMQLVPIVLELSARNTASPGISNALYYTLNIVPIVFLSTPIPSPLPQVTTPQSSMLTYMLLGKRVWWANTGQQQAQRLRNSILPLGTVFTFDKRALLRQSSLEEIKQNYIHQNKICHHIKSANTISAIFCVSLLKTFSQTPLLCIFRSDF